MQALAGNAAPRILTPSQGGQDRGSDRAGNCQVFLLDFTRRRLPPVSWPAQPFRVPASRQFGVFRLGLREDRDVGVGVFPQSEEILVGGLRLGQISGLRERSTQLQKRQCAYGIRADDPTMTEDLLKFRNSLRISVGVQKSLAPHIRRVQT